MYVTLNPDGSIAASAEFQFPGSVRVDYNVMRGYDGRLYKEGKEPVKPQSEVEAEAFAALRAERDKRLADTDYMVMPDYPIDADKLAAVKAYRQALRDLPQQEGAPWIDGEIPWPVMGEDSPVEETEEVVDAEVETEPDGDTADKGDD